MKKYCDCQIHSTHKITKARARARKILFCMRCNWFGYIVYISNDGRTNKSDSINNNQFIYSFICSLIFNLFNAFIVALFRWQIDQRKKKSFAEKKFKLKSIDKVFEEEKKSIDDRN